MFSRQAPKKGGVLIIEICRDFNRSLIGPEIVIYPDTNAAAKPAWTLWLSASDVFVGISSTWPMTLSWIHGLINSFSPA